MVDKAKELRKLFTLEPHMVPGNLEHVSTPRAPLRVLVVDDDLHVAKALRRMLKRLCHVELASSVDEAERILDEKHDYALILCDLLLPRRSGVDLYRGLRKKNPQMAARLAFMTGMGDDATEAKEFREVPCLGKPVALERVRQLLDR